VLAYLTDEQSLQQMPSAFLVNPLTLSIVRQLLRHGGKQFFGE
jgi:hypothetical protein